MERARRSGRTANLHVFVVHDPLLDAKICAISGDAPSYVHGFRGRSTLFGTDDAAKLWLPQLTTGRRAVLGRLYDFVEPHETCPIFPFPAVDPRLGDTLAEEYLTEIEKGAALLRRRPKQSLRRRQGRRQLRLVVLRKRRRGPVSDGPCAVSDRWGVLARFVEGVSTHQSAGCPWQLEDRQSRTAC